MLKEMEVALDPKQASDVAKKYIAVLFASDGATNIGLEELQFDDVRGIWSITIGFTRTWEGPQGLDRWNREGKPWPRTFKTVEIDDKDSRVLGVKHWPVAA